MGLDGVCGKRKKKQNKLVSLLNAHYITMYPQNCELVQIRNKSSKIFFFYIVPKCFIIISLRKEGTDCGRYSVCSIIITFWEIQFHELLKTKHRQALFFSAFSIWFSGRFEMPQNQSFRLMNEQTISHTLWATLCMNESYMMTTEKIFFFVAPFEIPKSIFI